ncbi:MAG: lysophospholipid acyltransferase family protein [Candidatus Neomarinimicrobiota bacterium]
MRDLNKYRPRPLIIRYLSGYFTLFMLSLASRVKVYGRQFIPDRGPYIIAANHFSVLDPIFIIYATQRPINFLMASDQVVGNDMFWAPWIYGFIPTNRSKLAPSTIKTSLQVLRKNEILGIFPEATSLATELRPAKEGAAYLSLATNVPILPVSVTGHNNLWKNLFRGVRQTVTVRIGRAFGPFEQEADGKSRQQLLEEIGLEIMCRIGALLPEEQRGFVKNHDLVWRFREENDRHTGYKF